MIDTIKQLLGFGAKTDYSALVKEGAIVLDVRTKGEYSGGHIQGSINISLDNLVANLGRLKDKDQVIITCCASGMRSASAKNILRSKGYTRVYNGGGWYSLQNKIR